MRLIYFRKLASDVMHANAINTDDKVRDDYRRVIVYESGRSRSMSLWVESRHATSGGHAIALTGPPSHCLFIGTDTVSRRFPDRSKVLLDAARSRAQCTNAH